MASLDPAMEMRVALTFSASGLQRQDFMTKSDPYLLLKDARGGVLGRTETAKNTSNPKFSKELEVVYRFEEEQVFNFVLMDDDFGKSADDYLGEGSFKLGTLMGTRGQTIKVPVTYRGSGNKGFLTVHAEQANSDDVLQFQFKATKLDNKDGMFSKSDPYFILSCQDNPTADVFSADGWRVLYKSEVIPNNLNPCWNAATLPVRRLEGKKLRLEVLDHDDHGKHDLIGFATFTLQDIQAYKTGIPVIHPPTKSKYKSSSYVSSGYIDCIKAVLDKRYTMIDYLRGGLEVNLVVAVDFTGSNGDPSKPGSLHYGGGTIPNPYTTALSGVASVLLEYDSNKMVPALGFGARLRNGQVSHCFPMTLGMGGEEVYGVQGILSAYQTAFASGIALSGPTYFSEILRKTIQIARNSMSYTVVLILTDGVLNDIQETIDSLVELSLLPVSVIIVGVGSADFSQMRVLDADVAPLVSSRGVRSDRDCVQFVEFNRVGGNGAVLARETLMELPQQIVTYMAKNKRVPGRPIVVQEAEIQTVGMFPPAAPGGVAVPPPPVGGVVPPPPVADVAAFGKELFRGAISM